MRKTAFVIFVVFVAIFTCGKAGNLEAGPQLEIAEDSAAQNWDNSQLREIRTADNSRTREREIGQC